MGAAFTRAAVERGIQFKIVHEGRTSTKFEARQLELKLKIRKNHAQLLRRIQNVSTHQTQTK